MDDEDQDDELPLNTADEVVMSDISTVIGI
jgi:hypothetical protein